MKFSSIVFSLVLLAAGKSFAANPLAPSNLRSCDKVRPAGTENKPFFGWYINDPDDNEIQSAYQILVATSPALLNNGKADIWDSGKTGSRSQNYIDFLGKELRPGTRYYWKVRTWDKGNQVSPYSTVSYFDTGLFTANDWSNAKWIKRNTTDPDDYTYYRKSSRLQGKGIARAMAYVTAFHNYELYINGSLIGKGLGHHYPQYAYYNAYDVSKALKPNSSNTFAALAHWYGGGQGRAKGDRGFLLKVVVEYTDGTTSVIGTDQTWKQKAAEQFNPKSKRRNGEGIGYIDIIDSRNELANWNKTGFDDSSWQPAVEIGSHPVAPFTGDLQPDLTVLKEEVIKPVSVKSLGKGSYLIDLGKIYAGMPAINFEGGNAGDTVSMRAGFILNDDGTVSAKFNQDADLSYFFILNGKKAQFKPFVYLGYRYLQVNNSPNVLTTANVSFTARRYELEPRRASFSSSNPMLNQVWNLMIHSLALGAQEGFVDTPTREKGEFLGDAWSQGVAAMLTMGERALNHRVLLEFLDSQDQYWPDGRLNAVYPNADGKRDIPDYTQQYLVWVWEYYQQTGNLEFLRANYNKLRKIAAYVDIYKSQASGLIHKLAGGSGSYLYGIIDWPASMRYGYDMAAEARTVINAYAYADFEIMSKIAAAVGNTADASLFSNKAEAIKNAINGRLLNAQGVYIDGLLADNTQSTHVSQHANMMPLAMGIVPDANRKAVINAVKERKMSVGMVALKYLPEAIGEAGEGAHLLELYTNPQWDGWAQTISQGGTATWESWDAPKHNHSMSHPWGTIGLAGIQQYFVGVKALKPQYELVQIKPLDFEGKLEKLSGAVPTDKGDIKVDWVRNTKSYKLSVATPVNVIANVYVPKGSVTVSQVKVDGKLVQATAAGKYLLVENVGSGKHVFELEF